MAPLALAALLCAVIPPDAPERHVLVVAHGALASGPATEEGLRLALAYLPATEPGALQLFGDRTLLAGELEEARVALPPVGPPQRDALSAALRALEQLPPKKPGRPRELAVALVGEFAADGLVIDAGTLPLDAIVHAAEVAEADLLTLLFVGAPPPELVARAFDAVVPTCALGTSERIGVGLLGLADTNLDGVVDAQELGGWTGHRAIAGCAGPTPVGLASAVRVPKELAGRFAIRTLRGVRPLVAFEKPVGREVRLALPSGAYQVLKVEGDRAVAAPLILLAGRKQGVRAESFNAETGAGAVTRFESLVPPDVAPHATRAKVSARGTLGLGLDVTLRGPKVGPELGGGLDVGRLSLLLLAEFRAPASSPAPGSRLEAGLQLFAGYAFPREESTLTPFVSLAGRSDFSGAPAELVAAGLRASIPWTEKVAAFLRLQAQARREQGYWTGGVALAVGLEGAATSRAP